jgi:glycosyltransferase involved in cell wall biosynthesis
MKEFREVQKQPLVSVIIPCYNHAKYIGEAIRSVESQDYGNHEIIVVDDGSTDNTKDILKTFENRTIYLRQENKGPSAARNLGIASARGEFIAFLDADDLWSPGKLRKQMKAIQEDQSVGLVACGEFEIDQSGKILGGPWVYGNYPSREKLLEALSIGQVVPGGTSGVLIRKECFLEVGEFDVSLKIGEDWDMWLRIIRKYNAVFVVEPLVMIRKGGSVSWSATGTTGESVLCGPKKEEFYVTKLIEKNLIGVTKRRGYANLYYRLGIACLSGSMRGQAFKYLMRSILLRPFWLYTKESKRLYFHARDLRYSMVARSLIPNFILKEMRKLFRST